MITLQEILDELDDKADELEVEAINAVEYFANRLGLTDSELIAFAEERSFTNYEDATSIRDAMVSNWLEAFMVGIMVARKKGAWQS